MTLMVLISNKCLTKLTFHVKIIFIVFVNLMVGKTKKIPSSPSKFEAVATAKYKCQKLI